MIKGMHQWQAMSTVLCVWSQGVGAVPDIRGAIHLCTQANGQHMGLAQVRGGTESWSPPVALKEQPGPVLTPDTLVLTALASCHSSGSVWQAPSPLFCPPRPNLLTSAIDF